MAGRCPQLEVTKAIGSRIRSFPDDRDRDGVSPCRIHNQGGNVVTFSPITTPMKTFTSYFIWNRIWPVRPYPIPGPRPIRLRLF